MRDEQSDTSQGDGREVDDPVEQEVLEAFNDVLKRMGTASYEDLVAALQEIEHRYVARLADRPEAVLEIRRRVAEDTLTAACIKQKPVEACESLLHRIESLGWTDLYTKQQNLFPFCRYCLDHGRKDVGRRYLAPLVAEVEAEAERSQEAWLAQALPSLRRLLAQLEE